MIKNKSKLAIKLFIAVWIVLALHITLKLTFNYWQPYVIPNDTLQIISDFIDNNFWIRRVFEFITYTFNGVVMLLASLQLWWFKSIKQTLIVFITIILGFVYFLIFNDSIINTIVILILLPLLLNYRKWLLIIINFGLNNLFLALSLWLTGFVNCDDMPYIVQSMFLFDYYIMLILSYFVFNFIRKEKKVK